MPSKKLAFALLRHWSLLLFAVALIAASLYLIPFCFQPWKP